MKPETAARVPPGAVFLVLLVALVTVAPGCSQQLSVEQQVIAVIRDMEARLEAVERRPFMNHVAPDFNAQDGRMNREQFNAMVLYYIHRYKRLSARLLPIQVEAGEGDTATARFRVLFTGGENWMPDAGRVYQVESRWRMEDGEWLLAAARWEALELENVLE
ncbi:hypothetical protein [Elongatibacter sediminis]|uniref:DUF4440 domain-containing protein n=1 Tax=Elongatibacter sediminis TaxID=3119006 RepID=A0AAW9RLD4_9GAMM